MKHPVLLMAASALVACATPVSDLDTGADPGEHDLPATADMPLVDAGPDGGPDSAARDVPEDPDTSVDAGDTTSNGDPADLPADAEMEVTEPYRFVPLEPTVPDPDPSVRICAEAADPVGAPDKVDIDCPVEAGRFAPEDAAPGDRLVVMAYNLERGAHLEGQVAAIQAMDPPPDVILASELDRGCARSGDRHVARDLAQALDMDWAFAVEFVELRTVDGDPPYYVAECEHGNAILSRFPLGNVRALRHETQASWYFAPGTPGDQPRLGGRVAVLADVALGNRHLHLGSLHLESAIGDAERTAQATEIARVAAGLPHPVVIGGDLNAGLYFLDVQQGETVDPTVAALASEGFADAHQGLPYEARVTAPAYGFVLDLVLGRGIRFDDPGIGDATWDALSDHRPVWADAILDAPGAPP